jgi:hypothetical protein
MAQSSRPKEIYQLCLVKVLKGGKDSCMKTIMVLKCVISSTYRERICICVGVVYKIVIIGGG